MISQIHATDLKAKLDAGDPVYLLDVRQPNEHAYARIADSTLIPLHELPGRLDEVDPPVGALVVVYCHHGVRSRAAAEHCARMGFRDVWNVEGGIDAWSLRVDPSVPRY